MDRELRIRRRLREALQGTPPDEAIGFLLALLVETLRDDVLRKVTERASRKRWGWVMAKLGPSDGRCMTQTIGSNQRCVLPWRHDGACAFDPIPDLARAVSDLAREISAVGPLARIVLKSGKQVHVGSYAYVEGAFVDERQYLGLVPMTEGEIAANLAATEAP